MQMYEGIGVCNYRLSVSYLHASVPIQREEPRKRMPESRPTERNGKVERKGHVRGGK